MRRRNKVLLTLLLVSLAAATTLALFWKGWAERAIRAGLEAQGFKNIEFSVGHIGPSGITLKDISLGDLPLKFDELTADYSLPQLLQGKLRELRASELASSVGEKTKIRAENVTLRFDNARQGTWKTGKVEVEEAPLALPPLTGAGTWKTEGSKIRVEGSFKSQDNKHRAAFDVDYGKDDPTSKLTVQSATIPWEGGIVSTRNASFPLAGSKPATIRLEVKGVSLDALMQLLSKERAHATGKVSGVIPLSIGKGGDIRVGQGNLKAESAGTITMGPDAVPEGNEQLNLLRQLLSNFHYKELTLSADSDAKGNLKIILAVLGNNPQVYEGRAIKLNVHLGGDVLDLLRQSIAPLSDPASLLKQEKDAEP